MATCSFALQPFYSSLCPTHACYFDRTFAAGGQSWSAGADGCWYCCCSLGSYLTPNLKLPCNQVLRHLPELVRTPCCRCSISCSCRLQHRLLLRLVLTLSSVCTGCCQRMPGWLLLLWPLFDGCGCRRHRGCWCTCRTPLLQRHHHPQQPNLHSRSQCHYTTVLSRVSCACINGICPVLYAAGSSFRTYSMLAA